VQDDAATALGPKPLTIILPSSKYRIYWEIMKVWIVLNLEIACLLR